MTRRPARLLLASMFVATATTFAGAQGSATSSISGVVKDSGGGVIPGATVVVTSNATTTKFETVTNSTGSYSVPPLPAGTYTVSASLEGFKTAIVTDVRVQPGRVRLHELHVSPAVQRAAGPLPYLRRAGDGQAG